MPLKAKSTFLPQEFVSDSLSSGRRPQNNCWIRLASRRVMSGILPSWVACVHPFLLPSPWDPSSCLSPSSESCPWPCPLTGQESPPSHSASTGPAWQELTAPGMAATKVYSKALPAVPSFRKTSAQEGMKHGAAKTSR